MDKSKEYRFGDKVVITKPGFWEGVKAILVGELGDGRYVLKIKGRQDIWLNGDDFKLVKEK